MPVRKLLRGKRQSILNFYFWDNQYEGECYNAGKRESRVSIYGYVKDLSDKYHGLVDEEAAAVVRRIFQLTIEGHGPYEIATMPCEEKVEMPAAHFARQGRGVWKSKEYIPRPYNWNGFEVGQILAKPEYIGHTVNFRTHKEFYKDRSAVVHSTEDWLIFENTHKAIVDKDTWKLAQELRKTPRRHDTIGEANPLTLLHFRVSVEEEILRWQEKLWQCANDILKKLAAIA